MKRHFQSTQAPVPGFSGFPSQPHIIMLHHIGSQCQEFWSLAVVAASVGLLSGCETLPPGAERGPHGTMAFNVLVGEVIRTRFHWDRI